MAAPFLRASASDGYAAEISGGEEADRLVALLGGHNIDARNVAEFGIGTNDKAIISGLILEDEKVMGTIHIAFGAELSSHGIRTAAVAILQAALEYRADSTGLGRSPARRQA